MISTAIRRLDADESRAAVEPLAGLLIDAVGGGASLGFMPPLEYATAAEFWEGVAGGVAAGRVILLVAGDPIVGTVQLQLPIYPNGHHRGMVSKLIVHRSARRRGVGEALMAALEEEALRSGRTMLYLDTQTGSDAEQFYDRLGWQRAGVIPDFAYAPDGKLWPSTFYFKLLRRRT